MRKRTVTHFADTIFWYIVYFLPVICAVLALNGMVNNDIFWVFMVDNENIDTDSIAMFTNLLGAYSQYFGFSDFIYDTLFSLFSPFGIVELLDPNMLIFFSYFVSVYIVHLCVDFLLFIPRLTHKWMNDFTRGDV